VLKALCYKPFLEFIAYKHHGGVMPDYSDKKNNAVANAMHNHSYQIGSCIRDLSEAKEALATAGIKFHPQLEKFNRSFRTLSRMKELTDEFIDHLEK
jgi:hypothetical protein